MAFTDRFHNRGSVSTGYDIDNSLKLESDNTERVNKVAGTISGAGNRRTFTISFWTKRTEINGVKQYLFEAGNSDNDNDRFTIRFGTGNTLDIQTSATYLITERVFRDTSAWYHIVVKVDTTDGTAANRIKLYVNGVEETTFATDNRSNINQNFDFSVNNTEDHIIGNSMIEGSKYYNGYIAEWIQLDGTAAAPTSFGEFDEDSGIWIPKDPSALSFGTNGFWLDFEDSSNLGNDASGGTDFSLTNVAAADQATDTPTNNFCTLNPLNRNSATASNNPSYTDGNTKTIMSLTGYWQTAIGSIGVTSGKWYMEGQLIYDPQMAGIGVGDFGDIENWGRNNDWIGASKAVAYGTPKAEVGDSLPSSANDYTNSHIVGVALDADNGKVYWSRDGTYQSSGDPAGNSSGIALPTGGTAIGLYMFGVSGYKATHGSYPGTVGWLVNFGGFTTISISSAATDANGYGTFEYAPPTGFYALCTKNLAEYGG